MQDLRRSLYVKAKAEASWRFWGLILEPIFEADFQAGSYGYRPNRTAHAAVAQVAQGIVEEKTRVIDLDLVE